MSSLDQYHAARNAAAIFDRSSRGKISLTGADRASFLHALLTNDIAKIAAGGGVYSAYLTPQGRMISDMRVIEAGGEMLLDVEGDVAPALAARLDKLVFSEDVQVRDVTGELAELGVCGPQAASVLERATGIPSARLEAMAQYDNLRTPGAAAVTVVRDDSLGVPGFDLYVPVADAGRWTSAIVEAGAVRADAGTFETLRIEAGHPRFGVDMDAETIPLEAGIEGRAISMTKGCYVGQEVIVRVLHRGHGRVARRLVSLVLEAGDRVPVRDALVMAGDREAGRITSATRSPLMNAPLALGYVQRDFAVPGTALSIDDGTVTSQATVHQLCD